MFSPQQDPKQLFDRIFGSTSALLKGGLNKGADAAEGLYNNFHSAAEQTGVPQAIGGATGALGGAIGGAVGGLGNFFSQSLQGKGLDPKLMGQDIANTARSTANFGYQTGKEGAIAAPMANAGKLVSGAMALPPARGVMQDVQSGNVNLGTGLKAGAAAASMYGAAKSPNWTPGGVFDPQLKALAGKIQDSVGMPGGMTMHKANYEMLAKAIRDADIPDTEKQGFLRSLYPNLKSDNQNFDPSRFDEAVNSGSLFRKSSASPKMSSGDYELVADAIKTAVDNGDVTPQSAQAIFSSMEGGLSSANPRFNLERFKKAANLLGKEKGQIVNSMDDGLDTSSNYGENLMNNDGGAVDSKYLGASPSHQDWMRKLAGKAKDAGTAKALLDGYAQEHGISPEDVQTVMKGGKQLLPQTSKNSINTYSDGTFKYKDPTGGLENIDSATFGLVNKGAQPGKWTDAYSRPMDAGVQFPNGRSIRKGQFSFNSPSEIAQWEKGASGGILKSVEDPISRSGAMVSVPKLTPAQQGAVSKIIKQSQALKGKMGK